MITLLVEQLYIASTGKTHFMATNFFKIYSNYSNCLGVLHAITMRGRRRGSKEKDTVTNKKDKIANTYKILFIFFLNALMWHEYEYYRNLVGLVQIFHSK